MNKNKIKSIRSRLLNIAKEEQIDFNQILLLYFHERLLYRLSNSKYNSNFFLKGGILILSTTNFKLRPTKDIDFLAENITNDLEKIKNVFKNISQIQFEDGVEFETDSIQVEKITEGAEYEGVRLNIIAYLGKARKRIQLDVGFGDVIVPQAKTLNYPSLLEFEAPKINAYSLESIIAEKFEAMLKLGQINSRMKDFYDIYMISKLKQFDGRVLQEAIYETFQKRGTSFETNPIIFKEKFAEDEQRIKMWNNYLKRINQESISFHNIMNRLKTFLFPVYKAVINEKEFFRNWDNQNQEWINYS
ncbi:nucleotidyl transferase AbiEii/AbiGii toxin family protein [Halanaerobacter jeridensis]|uniref:Nucleotidyltransferase component of viral defense system n=1 Tax=Halanaerobacter jeridensis TaxID=706427 RepID=A0A939BNU2_9FIRM|nr:putative nucleotidyltransferase component of viral defense system [Halanaerobacter jeridensis]